MSALFIVLFILGVVVGILRPYSPKHVKRYSVPQNHDHNRLDTVDEMVLYGEVTGDEFYRM